MPIPDYETIMFQLLKFSSDANEHSSKEGIDGVTKEDVLDLDALYIQAKKCDGVIRHPEIQKFAGALQGQRAKKVIFITTGNFSKETKEYTNKIDN